MNVNVGCRLTYQATARTPFIFQFEAVRADGQTITSERLTLPNRFDAFVDPSTQNRIVRTIMGPGEITIEYEARVHTLGLSDQPQSVAEMNFMNLPQDVLPFLAPSRYCPSDTFTEFSFAAFGNVAPGHARIKAICDWIFGNIRYEAGSTGPNSSAAEVFQAGAGVCRDFAHLGISLCRALGIPARYTSVYAADLSPQDFHATFQAYLIGPHGPAWYMFDPTRMSSADAVVRIAAGRDAADVAFSWPQAPVTLTAMDVWALAEGRNVPTLTSAAVPTA